MDIKNKNNLRFTFSLSHFPTCSPAPLPTCKGFSLLELLICIVILALFVTIVATNAGKFDEDVKIAAALKDMKAIQTAIVNNLYPDLGYLPCGIDKSSTDERKMLEALFVPAYLSLERGEIKGMIESLECLKEGYIGEWEKYESKGWRGPYIKAAGGIIDATYFDEVAFPEKKAEHVYLDSMLTPWAETCEKRAREAEEDGDPDLAKQYRKGKYYQVFYPQITLTRPVYNPATLLITGWGDSVCQISRDGGYIVCRGADCLPSPPQEDPDDPVDVAAYLKCEAKIKENAVEECKNEATTVDGLRACVKEIYEKEYPGCYEGNDPVPLEKRLSITDTMNKYYMDIGDDLVMSVFGSVMRSPMDR